MKRFLFFAILVCLLTSKTYGQEFNESLNKDSLLQTIIKDLPEGKKAEILKRYNEGNEQTKEFFLVMFSMPRSSKKEMIANIDSNFDNINTLKTEYSKLIPKNYIVSIEFNPADKISMAKESIDLTVEDTSNNQSNVAQDWNLEYNSKKLTQMIKPLGWTNETLLTIKKLLANAHCVSIENGGITTIGFARTGMGMYFFKLFNNDLTDTQIKEYDDACTYIFYKKNIVLEYGGGAVGTQCFPD